MSSPKYGKRVNHRWLNRGQAVPCDGWIYWDESGQGWFGIAYPLDSADHYQLLLAEAAKYERRKKK